MISSKVYSSEILSSKKFKPAYFLNVGKRNMLELSKKGLVDGCLGTHVSSIFRPGIFKRIFVENKDFGRQYFTASDMMTSNPLHFAKLLSNKLTSNMDYMSVHDNYILVSCAGTIGNIRLIDKILDNSIASQDIIRVIPNNYDYGFVYAYLKTPTVYNYLQSLIYGSVVSRIEPEAVFNIPYPKLANSIITDVHNLIVESVSLREEASKELSFASQLIKSYAGLDSLVQEDYDYYGPRTSKRQVSCFIRNRKDIDSITINAFNHSERIRKTIKKIFCQTVRLKEILENHDVFTTGSFPRVEVKEGNGIMLINQSDIFDSIIKGKYISKRNVKLSNLVEYGEVLIAGVGTLGENETFCRTIFANEDLVGQLVSGEFIRMKTNDKVPSGYLYTWLSSDYGFRLIRNLQTGTKLCRPIPRLVLEIPVPILEKEQMKEIDRIVKEAHTKKHKANCLERKAILMVEQEIEKWNN